MSNMLSVVMLNVVMLNVVMLNVVMQNVVAPINYIAAPIRANLIKPFCRHHPSLRRFNDIFAKRHLRK
jgi:hypothetical protein